MPMTTVVTTASGSIYELDTTRRRVRRVHGHHAPTDRQGHDGDWADYHAVNAPEVGRRLLIVWDVEGVTAKATVTTPVVTVHCLR
jgi:hypothetical protein